MARVAHLVQALAQRDGDVLGGVVVVDVPVPLAVHDDLDACPPHGGGRKRAQMV